MVEFTIRGEELWTRMERAVEKVNERSRHVRRAPRCFGFRRGACAARRYGGAWGEPNPDIVPGVRTDDLQTVALETLVRMKLNAFRRKDQVHILDMLSLGMIDTSWLDRYPEPLRQRLQQLLDDPDG